MKDGVLKFVHKAKIAFTVFSVLMIAATIISLFFATRGFIGFMIISAILVVSYLVARVLYDTRISLGAVFQVEINAEQLTLRTPKKNFTYDLVNGCKKVVVKQDKFICFFESAGSTDSFIFYRHVPFSKYEDVQFTPSEIKLFYPQLVI